MSEQRITPTSDEVLKAISESSRPLSDTEVLLNVLSNRGLRMKEEPGEAPSKAIRKHFNIGGFRRVLEGLAEEGKIQGLTGAEWADLGRSFYDQRPTSTYWVVRQDASTEPPTEAAAAEPRVLKVMTSPRQQIHQANCAPHYACKYFAKTGPGGRRVSPSCVRLDELLDFNDEMVLHGRARELEIDFNEMPMKARNTFGAGLLYAVREVDPYEKVDEGGVVEMLSPRCGEKDPDCPACVAGKEHYHRKSDGSPVVSPDRQQNGTT